MYESFSSDDDINDPNYGDKAKTPRKKLKGNLKKTKSPTKKKKSQTKLNISTADLIPEISSLPNDTVCDANGIKIEPDTSLVLDNELKNCGDLNCTNEHKLDCSKSIKSTSESQQNEELISKKVPVKEIKRRNRQKCPLSKARLCPDCGFVSNSSKQFSYHRKYYHCPEYDQKRQDNRGIFECAECSKKFTRLNSLTEHMQIHNPNNPNICEMCSKPFCSAKQLRDHQKTHSDYRPWKCEYCNEGFKTKKTLSSHIVFHTRVRKFLCTQCDKSYFTRNALNVHQQIHEPTVNLECEICHNTYTSHKSLKAHLLIHDVSKRTKCTYCEKTFIGSKHKMKHMRTHPEFEPLRCKYCSKPFFSEKYIEYHIRIHHTEEMKRGIVN